MCQKAVAGPFGVYAVIPLADFAWTRGAPATWVSSSVATRDFCSRCGTPLAYRVIDGSDVEILTGSLDQPARAQPTYELGTEAKLAWLAELSRLPGKSTLENIGAEEMGAIIGHQHPDHDTPAP